MTELPEMTDKEKALKDALASVDAGLLKSESLNTQMLELQIKLEDSHAKLIEALSKTD